MIRTSRRAIFRSVFGRTGFELPLDTANEVLMRLNRSLDPIPVSGRMWSSYLVNRRPLRYTDDDHAGSAVSPNLVAEVDAAVAHARFGDFPAHVVRDLTLLLRLEVLLRMWTAALGPGTDQASSEPRRRQIREGLRAELVRYVDHDGPTDAFPPELVDEVVHDLTTIAGRDRPSRPDTP